VLVGLGGDWVRTGSYDDPFKKQLRPPLSLCKRRNTVKWLKYGRRWNEMEGKALGAVVGKGDFDSRLWL